MFIKRIVYSDVGGMGTCPGASNRGYHYTPRTEGPRGRSYSWRSVETVEIVNSICFFVLEWFFFFCLVLLCFVCLRVLGEFTERVFIYQKDAEFFSAGVMTGGSFISSSRKALDYSDHNSHKQIKNHQSPHKRVTSCLSHSNTWFQCTVSHLCSPPGRKGH